MNRTIDIIGDVHGHASELESLLASLGWRERDGAFRHPDPARHAVFLGDLIDRGPEQVRSIDIPRRMRDAGTATVLMGNHEHNAIGYAMRDGTSPGGFLRMRGSKNKNQHAAFLAETGEDTPLHLELVGWMKTLPMFLDLGEAKAVHACWHEASAAALADASGGTGVLPEEAMRRSFAKGDRLRDAAEIALKGLEIDLPEGISFKDKDGHVRRKARTMWWDDGSATLSSGLFAEDACALLPDEPLPAAARVTCDEPVFFGHYWMTGEPSLASPVRACLDFSVAKGGYLCAYTWRGEPELDPRALTWVESPRMAAAPAA